MKMLLHTPEGVRDIYNKECENKLYLQEQIHKVMKLYGYSDIQTPTFEFFDVFGKDKGSTQSKNMYKFFDREGNTLVLRPDVTPSIARAVSKYFTEKDMPIRFCYMGNTFVNNAEHQGKLKEVTQTGAELIGDNRSDADVEAIALVINALLECGLTEFQIEIGHAGVISGMIQVADFDDEEADEFKELLDNKNFFGVEAFLNDKDVNAETKKLILKLCSYCGSIDIIKEAKEMTDNPLMLKAFERLEKVYDMLTIYGYEKYISFDLSNVSNHEYYTGITFKGYTYGTGDAVVTGGRYDNLLKLFGLDTQAMGFAINLDQLLIAMTRQNIIIENNHEKVLILYEEEYKKPAIEKANELRKKDIEVTTIRRYPARSIEEYKYFAKSNEMKQIIYFDKADNIEEINTQENN